MAEHYDTVFSLPSIDDEPAIEVGVLLMGFGPERLLAGLGVASRYLPADPATVTTFVDQLRHNARADLTFADAVAAGAARWRAASAGFAAVRVGAGTQSAALRQLWGAAAAALGDAAETVAQLRTKSDAEQAYLIACWLRRKEIHTTAEELCPI